MTQNKKDLLFFVVTLALSAMSFAIGQESAAKVPYTQSCESLCEPKHSKVTIVGGKYLCTCQGEEGFYRADIDEMWIEDFIDGHAEPDYDSE